MAERLYCRVIKNRNESEGGDADLKRGSYNLNPNTLRGDKNIYGERNSPSRDYLWSNPLSDCYRKVNSFQSEMAFNNKKSKYQIIEFKKAQREE